MTEQNAKIYDALSKAQAEFKHAKKSVNNAFFKSKYADLSLAVGMNLIANKLQIF